MKQALSVWLLLAVCFIFGNLEIYAQDSTGLINKIVYFPDKLFKKVNAKSEAINRRLITQSERYLRSMEREEKKLRRKLCRKDSAAAKKIFGDAAGQYAVLQQRIKNVPGNGNALRRKYLPHLDSLQTAFNFLDKTEGWLNKNPRTGMALKDALGKMDLLQEQFNQAENIKQYLKQRRQFLQEQLGKYGLTKDLKKLQRQVYYYQAQVEEYKKAFETPSLLETKALAVLEKTSLFRKFFREHAQLAALFRLPEASAGNPIAGFAGYQTRDGVQQQLLQRFRSASDVQQVAQQQARTVESPLGQLKNKLRSLGSGNNDIEMPDFTPNNQKTKSFKDRLELGTNLQTVKSNNFFPSTSDLAVSLGYKMNDKSTIGIGSSYKIGWGKDIRHITITHQGIGLRSFVDYRIKGSFWLSGGAEMNYKSQFKFYEILNNYTPWQKSALVGLSKKYQVSKNVRGNLQLLYDFLYKEQVPRTQALLFRIGYMW